MNMRFPCISIFADPKEMKKLLLMHAVIFSLGAVVYFTHYCLSLHGLIDQDGHVFGRDFIEYWAVVVLIGKSMAQSAYTVSAFNDVVQSVAGHTIAGLDFRYPPHFLLLLWSLSFIQNYKLAYGVWLLLNIALFFLAVFWRSQIAYAWRWIICTSPAVLFSLFAGQTGLLIAAFLVGGFRLLPIAPVWAGVILALLSFKPQFFILVPLVLLVLRQYKALCAMAVTLVVLFVVTGIAFGCQIWPNWINNTIAIQSHLDQTFIGKMISVNSNALLVGFSAHQAMCLQILVSLCVMAWLAYRLYFFAAMTWPDRLMLITPVIFLFSPYGFVYDMPVFGAVLVIWLAGRHALKPLHSFIWLLIWYAPFLNDICVHMRLPLVPILLVCAFLWEIKSRQGKAV